MDGSTCRGKDAAHRVSGAQRLTLMATYLLEGNRILLVSAGDEINQRARPLLRIRHTRGLLRTRNGILVHQPNHYMSESCSIDTRLSFGP